MSTYVQKRLTIVQQGLVGLAVVAPLVSSGGETPSLSLTPGGAVGDLLVWDGAAWVVQSPVARLLASGLAILDDGFGGKIVANALVSAGSRFVLTWQDGGAGQTGAPMITARTVGVDFTIQSTAGAPDNGAFVYWQIWSA